jgi:hypothetical protein
MAEERFLETWLYPSLASQMKNAVKVSVVFIWEKASYGGQHRTNINLKKSSAFIEILNFARTHTVPDPHLISAINQFVHEVRPNKPSAACYQILTH